MAHPCLVWAFSVLRILFSLCQNKARFVACIHWFNNEFIVIVCNSWFPCSECHNFYFNSEFWEEFAISEYVCRTHHIRLCCWQVEEWSTNSRLRWVNQLSCYHGILSSPQLCFQIISNRSSLSQFKKPTLPLSSMTSFTDWAYSE